MKMTAGCRDLDYPENSVRGTRIQNTLHNSSSSLPVQIIVIYDRFEDLQCMD
jgi:hypothetical protein